MTAKLNDVDPRLAMGRAEQAVSHLERSEKREGASRIFIWRLRNNPAAEVFTCLRRLGPYGFVAFARKSNNFLPGAGRP